MLMKRRSRRRRITQVPQVAAESLEQKRLLTAEFAAATESTVNTGEDVTQEVVEVYDFTRFGKSGHSFSEHVSEYFDAATLGQQTEPHPTAAHIITDTTEVVMVADTTESKGLIGDVDQENIITEEDLGFGLGITVSAVSGSSLKGANHASSGSW